MGEMDEILQEFLLESYEALDQLDRDFVELEDDPTNRDILAGVFRRVHTIKGTCGFLAFEKLESVTHVGENLLSLLRDGAMVLDADIANALLRMVDVVREILGRIEANGAEGDGDYTDLVSTLSALHRRGSGKAEAPAAAPAAASAAEDEVRPPEAGADEVLPPIAASRDEVLPPAPAAEDEVLPPSASSDDEVRPPARAESDFDREVASANEAIRVREQARATATQIAAAAAEQISGTSARPAPAPAPAAAPPAPAAAETDEPAAAAGATGGPAAKRGSVAESSIRIDVGLLDRLMTLVGELVLARNQVLQHTAGHDDAALASASQRLNHITSELQESVMKTRMQAIGTVWSRFPRTVRDLAQQCGKRIRLEMEGKETELDKTLVEAIKDPLTHVVRNSVDHGIESPADRVAAGKPEEGVLTLRAFHESGMVIIEMQDDGAGIDPARIRRKVLEKQLVPADRLNAMTDREVLKLIFYPGFSTAEKVTNVSGRGVGMDVVRTNIEKIGGTVDVSSTLGEGTTLRIRIPLTLAIVPALMVTTAGERFAIPQANLVELVRVAAENGRIPLEFLHGAPVYRLRGNLLPLVDLAEQLGFPGTLSRVRAKDIDDEFVVNIIVLSAEGRRFGLIVESIRDTEEIVVKALGRRFQDLDIYAGATIMGDGRVSLILDVAGIARTAGLTSDLDDLDEQAAGAASSAKTTPLLLVDSMGGDRLAVALRDVARLEEIPHAEVEEVGDQNVVQYRGEIMPLIDVCTMLPERRRERRAAPSEGDPELIQVVVLNDNGRSVGLVFAEIVDIVEADLSVRKEAARDYVKYSAVVRDRVTEVLDTAAIVRAGDPRRAAQAAFETAEV